MKLKEMGLRCAMLAGFLALLFSGAEASAGKSKKIIVTNSSSKKILVRVYFSAKGCSGGYDGRTGVCGLRTKVVKAGGKMTRKFKYWSPIWSRYRGSVSCKGSDGKWKTLVRNQKYSSNKITVTTDASKCAEY